MGKHKRTRTLGRLRHIWEDNIRMDLKESRRESVDLIDLVQDRNNWRGLVNKARIPWVPCNAGNFLTAEELLASQEGLCCNKIFS